MIRKRARPTARRWRACLAALLPVGALLAVFVTAAPASAAPSHSSAVGPESYFGPIRGYGSMCLDDNGALLNNYNAVDLYTCKTTGLVWNQEWNFNGGNGTIALNGGSMCLDVYAGGNWDGDAVDLYSCDGTGAQVWVPEPGGALRNPQSGKCLDDPRWSTTPGTQLDIWACNGGANQNFAMQP